MKIVWCCTSRQGAQERSRIEFAILAMLHDRDKETSRGSVVRCQHAAAVDEHVWMLAGGDALPPLGGEPPTRTPAERLLDAEPSLAIAKSSRVATRLPSVQALQQHHEDVGAALTAQLEALEHGWNGGSPLFELRRLLSVTDGDSTLDDTPAARAAASSTMASSLAAHARNASGVEDLPHDITPPVSREAVGESSIPYDITPPSARSLIPVDSPRPAIRSTASRDEWTPPHSRRSTPRSALMRELLASGAVVIDEGTPPARASIGSSAYADAAIAATANDAVASLNHSVQIHDSTAEIGERWRKVAVSWDARRRESWRQLAALMAWRHGVALAVVVQRAESQLANFAIKRYVNRQAAAPWRAWVQWVRASERARRVEAAAQQHAETTKAHSEVLSAMDEMLSFQTKSWETEHAALKVECETALTRLEVERGVHRSTARQMQEYKAALDEARKEAAAEAAAKQLAQSGIADLRRSMQKRSQQESNLLAVARLQHNTENEETHSQTSTEKARQDAVSVCSELQQTDDMTQVRVVKMRAGVVEDQLRALKAEVESLSKQLAAERAQKEHAQMECADVGTHLAAATADLQAQKTEKERVRAQLVACQQAFASLESEADKLRSELDASTVSVDKAADGLRAAKETAAAEAAVARQRWAADSGGARWRCSS
jgi:hypothetical protein